MKTINYNPSPLEVNISKAICHLEKEIEKLLTDNEIISVENKIHEDNPLVMIHLLDKDGDPHEVVLKIIQKPDKF